MKKLLPLLLSFAIPAGAAVVPATIETTGSSVTTTVLPDQSKIVKFLAGGTFTVPAEYTARVLLVGGGGAGGRDCSGGGGAGGMLEVSNVVLSAGTYTVTVGAGGQPNPSNSNVTGGNGGDTVLTFGGTDLYTAVGGGGGGSWGKTSGAAGGSGGGATSNGTGGAGVEGQGYAGGNANNRAPAGGGGAGGPGSQGVNYNGPGTAGGPGRASDITGEEVYYAGGGGGGGFNSGATLLNGGIGGGGNGARNANVATRQATTLPDGRNEYAAEAGVDGLGGGGGGANNSDFVGRPGGSGVLIVRFEPVVAGPEPSLNVLGVTDGPESVSVRAFLSSVGEDASSVVLSYAVATSVAALDSATPVPVRTGVVDGDEVPFTVSNLTAGTTYYVRVIAENNLGETARSEDLECLPYASIVAATAANAQRVFDVGQERVAVFGASSETMTFTMPERAAVELLLVGGGGAGGSYGGGGGGAGGFLHVETAVLDAGTYTVTVGAGGVPTTTDQRQGGSGGDTTLAKYGEAQNLYVAHGGGGGGGWYNASTRVGLAGGSGGGASIQMTTTAASTATGDERGNAGGASDAAHSGWNLANGGGGAGASGGHAEYSTGVGGAGGDGLPCSITGEEVWYAGGGGAGQNPNTVDGLCFSAGLGGLGGGGTGCSTSDDELDDWERGVDGLGGGGGGGRCDGTNAADMPRRGAPGGSGTLIVRWRATADTTARATIDSVAGSVAGAIVAGSVQLAGADVSGATLEMAVGASGGSLGAWQQLATGLGADERFTLTLSGLSSGTDYDYAIRVRSGSDVGEVLGAATGTFSTFASDPARLAARPADSELATVGTDKVYTFATPGTYTFTIATRGRARFLMVGGGGAGGSRRGGGGGAGGFIELPATTLEAGTYTVVVGAGGTPSTTQGAGGDGGDSTLSLDGTLLYTAHGGGGGGYGNKDAGLVNSRGHAGGSGGGGGPCAPVGGDSTAVAPELGNPGGAGSGKAADKFDSAAAGGGGAGGPGSSGYWSDTASGPNRRQGGAGGAGVASDITGDTLYYAGGGGGSVWYDNNGGYKGLGGSGVGGNGGGYTDEVNLNVTTPTPGVDGTGSGGGGGPNFNNSNDAQNRGAAGGCGAFILRLAADDSADLPEIVLETLSAESTTAEAVLALRNPGSGPTADLSLVFGCEPDAFDLSAPVAAGATPGLYQGTVSGLAPGRTWYFAPVASNAGGASTGAVLSVTIPAAGALPAGDGSSGLWQIARAAKAATFDNLFTNGTLWASATSSNLVSGALAADVETTVFADPVTGDVYTWPGAPAIYAYRGYIYLGGGKTVVFGARYGNSVRVAVDGQTLISTLRSSMTDAFGSLETEEAGWHEIEILVGHTTGSFGPDGDGNGSWADMGVAFNENGNTSPMPESGWTRILDSGDGSLLRPFRPEARTLSLTNAVASAGTLTLDAVVGSGENTAHAYLVYGTEDMGTLGTLGALGALGSLESLGWTVSDLGEVAAANAASDLAAQVAGWGSTAFAARLVLATKGLFAWTEPVTCSATALPSIGDAVVSDYASGDTATITASVSGGTGPYSVTLLLGPDAGSLAAVATTNLADAGGVSFALSGLTAGAQQFFQIVATDGNGSTARTGVLSYVAPGASRILDTEDVNTLDLWKAGNPYESRQRTIILGGTLSELGAGETTVRLLRNEGWYGYPAATSTQPHEGEELVLAAAGAYSLSHVFDWDQDVTANWSVSNATATQSWGPTAIARDSKSWANNITIVDATTYTWKGGDGLWTDAEKWTPDGVWDDIAGYPRRGSYAVFPGGTSVVSVPESAQTNRFARLTIPTGADVTFRPADGATDATLRMQTDSGVSHGSRGYSWAVAKNSKLTFAGEGLFVDFFNSWACYPNDNGTTIAFADGVRARIGSGLSNSAWTSNGKQDTLLAVTNAAEVTVLGVITVNGISSQLVVDDAKLVQPYTANDNNGIYLRGRNMNGKATLVVKGAHPVLQFGRRFTVTSSDNADKTQYVDFVVPEGGWSEAPIRSDPANTYALGQNSTANYKIVFRIPADSPAVVAGQSLDVPLVRWPVGVNSTFIETVSANLPHPDTDSFYTTVDAVSGQTTIWAHLVGQADTESPQASDFRVRSLSQTGADLSFVVIPGGGGATSVAVSVLDANGDAVAGATATPSLVSTSVYATNLVTVAGLDPDAAYTLRVTLDDGTNPAVTEDFAFYTLSDWGEGESDTADSVVEDGPYTVWTFTDTTPHAGTFTVTRGGLAEVLVVGGGGSGGAGANGTTYGGGGGGGGQVLATNVVLVPGTYSIQVGKGGAKVTSRAIGNNGASSSFAGIVAIGGGGGGYNSVGKDGASGGGGSNNKAGGAGTAGFAGGSAPANLAGGGGGGAGGVGAAGAGTFGGTGGAGVTNAISGYARVYGAGGGGGSSGSYSVYKAPGAGGDPTAGHGGELSYDGRLPANVATQNGTPGFGGGGGGGCASNDGADTSAGTLYGGAGGSGTVIVRMRTATAADPAPQASIKEETAGEADWTAALEIYTLGQGADHVDATLRVSRDGATTNDVPMATILSTGAATVVADGLAPGADYEGVLVLDNSLADGTLEIPVAFRTADAAATTVSGSSAWTFGKWTSAAADFHSTSLLRNKLPAVTIASTGAAAADTYPAARFSNGADDYYELNPDRLVTWTWDDPVYLTAFRVFYSANDYRSGVNVWSVEALGEDDTWTVISPTPGHYNESWGRNYGYLLPADGADYLWNKPAKGIRFTTDGFATTGYHNFREAEAEGVLAANQPADLSISSLSRTTAGVKALVAFAHELPADATVTALLAPTHGGTDLASWNAATSVVAQAGALSQNVAIDAAALAGMNYLRFRSDDGNGGVRWSETVYLPDVEILASIPPVVHFVAQRAATPATATLAASLVDAGSGAANNQADLFVRYAQVSNDVASASPVLVASGAAEGETAAVLSGLMPDRVYWGRFVAVNAEGGSGGTGASEFFTFGTAPDEAGGGAVSKVNGWYCDSWANETAVPVDNLLRGVLGTETTGSRPSLGSVANLTDGIVTESKYWAAASGTSVEFELGGAFSLSEYRIYQYSGDSTRRTISIASLEWRDEAGEWHVIPGSQLEFDVANNNCAFLRPADGSPYLAVGATAFRFTQGGGGSPDTHYIREMELLGEPSGGYRVLTVDAASWSGGTLSATVSRPVTNAVGTIYAVSGAAYHGTNETAWAADGGAAVSLGALAADQAAVSGTFTPAAGAVYVRFYEADGSGAVVAWSDTVPADEAAVRVVDSGVQADGDVAVFPIRVVSAGTGTLSVKVLLSDDPDFTNATEIAVSNPAIGDCTVTTNVTPGATYWYRVVAETTGGGFDETPAASFTTRAGSVLAGTVSYNLYATRYAVLRGTLDTLGAGVTTLEILTGDSASTLSVFDTMVLDRPGAFAYPGVFTGAPRTIYFRFHTVNVAPGGETWESWSSTSYFSTSDNVTYTWKKAVTEGAWNDPSNWTPSVDYECTGYPDYAGATVVFEDGTVATVTVPGKYRFGNWSVAKSNVDLVFLGNGPDVSGFGGNNDNMGGGKWVNSSMTFSALSLTEKDGVNFGDASKPHESRDSTLRFTDGAVASFGSAITAAGSNMWIVVESGATLGFRSNGPALAMKDGGIVLDDGTIDAARILTDYGWAQTTNQTILVSGAAPRIALTTSFRNESDTDASRQNADTTFLFSVPEGSWAEPVIYSEAEGEMFAGMIGTPAANYVIGISPESPFYQTARTRTVTLVAWKGGIDTDHVTLLPPPRTTTVYYTYGWPSVLTEPATAGDLPTGIRATLRGWGGTILILQ